MSNHLQTPAINSATSILSFDLETNGLHGKAFAVGAIVMDAGGTVLDEFSARARLTEKADDWVKNNVLPAIAEMPITHDNYEELREAFWAWYLQAKPKADYVLVNNGYPVEYRFLLDCQEANLDDRYWQHPFPILELSSLLLIADQISGATKRQLKKSLIDSSTHNTHHPLDDAKLAVRLAFESFRISGIVQK